MSGAPHPAEHPLAPTVLDGRHVRLEPLADAHADALWAVAQDPRLWEWTLSVVRTRADFDAYFASARAEHDAGQALAFATCSRSTGEVVGSTRFGNHVPAHGRVEIGWTWIGVSWQRTAVNTEAKRLMLGHAFDTLGLRRVEFKTDARNARSRSAIARLGATEEGTLRQHAVTAGGRVRDTVYFSLLAHEWPAVRDRLDARLAAS